MSLKCKNKLFLNNEKQNQQQKQKHLPFYFISDFFYSLFILLLLICGIIRATSASSLASASSASASSILSLVSLRCFHLIRFSNFILVYLSIYLYFIGDFFRSFVARVVVRLFCLCPTDRSKEIVFNLIYVQF